MMEACGEMGVVSIIGRHDPYGLDFRLWAERPVVGLIERKFGIRLGVTAVGGLRAKLELTPRKPPRLARQPKSGFEFAASRESPSICVDG